MKKQFITQQARTLEINPKDWEIPSEVLLKVLREEEDSFALLDHNGYQVDFPKSVFQDNHLEIRDDTILMSKSLYTHYFSPGFLNRIDGINWEITQNFGQLIKHKELILSKAEYFLMRPYILNCGAVFMGGFIPCIGAVLESWTLSDDLTLYDMEEEGQRLISLRGSPMSGSYSATVWSEKKQAVDYRNSSESAPALPDRFMFWFKKFLALRERYPIRIEADHVAMHQLLAEIGVKGKVKAL